MTLPTKITVNRYVLLICVKTIRDIEITSMVSVWESGTLVGMGFNCKLTTSHHLGIENMKKS